MDNQKKLRKSNNGRVICGVCAGLSEYFHVDVTIIRLIFAFLTLVGSAGIWIYLICALIMPKAED